MSYRVAKASEYLVITGAGIRDVKLAKKAWVWPGQRCTLINISAVHYNVQVHAMSSDKLRFLLTAVFTIGPRTDDLASLRHYVKLMPGPSRRNSSGSKAKAKVQKKVHAVDAELVNGIVQGEVRAIAASMTIEEIIKGSKRFKNEVFDKVQLELNSFGLFVYNANIRELVDTDGNDYFYNLSRKLRTEASYNAKEESDKAEAKGKMECKIRESKVAQNAARIDKENAIFAAQQMTEGRKEEIKARAETKLIEHEHEGRIAESAADLEARRAVAAAREEKARIESQKANAILEAELELDLQKKKASLGLEKLRAGVLNKATVESEAKYLQQLKYMDAIFYAEQKDAEMKKILADLDLYAKKQEAEALIAMSDAHSYHVRSMLGALGGNYSALRDYMMINNGMYKEIAKMSAESVKEIKPKICIMAGGKEMEKEKESDWRCHRSEEQEKGSSIYRIPPPQLERVREQTVMGPAMWPRAGRDGGDELDGARFQAGR